MSSYFQKGSSGVERQTYEVSKDLLDVMSATNVPPRLRPLAVELGTGSAMSSPNLLLRDLVSIHDAPELRRNIAGPATATLLGGSISSEGELDATGVTFSVSGGLVGFMTFAIPAALLVPGGGFYVAYRLYRMIRNAASLHRYARVSKAAPHVAIAVVVSDNEITRDEVRLLRDLLRGRVGSPTERHNLLELELDPAGTKEAAFEAVRGMKLEPDDWPALLSIAVATAHADNLYSGEEHDTINRFQELTDFSESEFGRMAAEAEAEYKLRCHMGEAMVRACYQIARAGDRKLPEDAAPLLDIVLSAAVPSDVERQELADELIDGVGLPAMSLEELTRGASDQKPSLFRRATGVRSEKTERLRQFGKTMGLFVATLEQWRGWVVKECRAQMVAIGRGYGFSEKRLLKWVSQAHRNIEQLRGDWIAPQPWEIVDEEVEVVVQTQTGTHGAFGVTGLAGGRFLFHRGDAGWEWRSTTTNFDVFVRTTLSLEVTELVVHADDTTFELLTVTVSAHDAEVDLLRASAPWFGESE